MITLPKYHGETAVFGLGRSGLSVVRALVAAGNRVSAWDQNGDQRAEAEKAGPKSEIWKPNLVPGPLGSKPRVPLTHPQPHAVVKRAPLMYRCWVMLNYLPTPCAIWPKP